jgi:hypothetical protein
MLDINSKEIQPTEKRTPYTGMSIEKSSERQVIDNLISADNIYGRDANPLYDKVGNLPGITIEEKRDYQSDHPNYRCAQYVFGTVKQEPWCNMTKNDFGLDFWDNMVSYLRPKGYDVVNQAQDGDIIAYRYKKTTATDPTVLHLGIYDKGKVISKFNSGHIFRHDVDRVPNAFGEEIVVFRKN